MTTSPLRLLALIATLATMTVFPAYAQAGETYTTSAWTDCGTATTGGQYDENRVFYIACGTNVWIKVGTAAPVKKALGATVQDIAPSPDGKYLYGIVSGALVRFDKQADGSFVRNATWKLPNITANGWTFAPSAVAVGTDGRGNIYVSHNAPADNVISKHSPDGKVLTVFGGYSNTPNLLGKFYLNRGVAPSRDGRYIYVVEKTGGVIERWDYQVDGSYEPTQQWGRYTKAGSCVKGEFAAPGDAVVDPWGFVYVMDTTCARVQKFTEDGTFVWAKSVGVKSHRFAVDSYGSVYTAEGAKKKILRAAGDTPTAAMPALQPLPEPPYMNTARTICPVEDWTNGAGQAAKDGTVYVACGHSIYVTESNGTELGRIALPTGAHYYDVAPSPDEKYLYVTRRVDAQGRAELKRLVRTGDAGLTYTLDANWKLANFTLGGTSWTPQGQFVATDVWGDIYFSNGGWSGYYKGAWDGEFVYEASPAVIVKYDPNGVVKTQFIGEKLGDFDVNMGVTVSRDGRTVYTVEHKAARVQRFDYQPNGEYHQTAASFTFGANDATCTNAAGLLTPYDLGVDPWGELWVANTGCRRLEKYTSTGTLIYAMTMPNLLHGVAVGLDGSAWVGQRNVWAKRSTQNPAPGPVPVPQPLETPDTAGPAIQDVIVPATTTTQLMTFEIRATDAHAITGMRLAREDGTWMAWEAFSANPSIASSKDYGPKGVYVQLRDELGNESVVVYRAYQYQAQIAPPDAQDPVLVTVTIPNPAPSRDITVTTTATDDTGVTEMRLANEDGNWGPWVAYSPAKAHHLSDAASIYKGVYVQVRDAAGRESNIIYKATVLG